MRYKLSYIATEDINFGRLKNDAVGGIIFSSKSLSMENLENAKKNKLKRFIHLGELDKRTCNYLSDCGIKEGKISFISPFSAEKAINGLGDLISQTDGFVMPIPCISGLFWDNSFPEEYEKTYGYNLYDELPVLFDCDTHYSKVRIWYYKVAAEKIFESYISPVCEYIKSCGKTVCVDLGNMQRGDYFIRKLLMPHMFRKFNIPTICEENGESYFVSPTHNKNSNTLFVTAIKDIMGMYVWDFPYSKLESDFSVAVWEAKYYRDSLKKCGIEAYIIDEFELSHMRTKTLAKFSNILLQRENIMDEKVRKELINMGVNINSSELLKRLDTVN
ncbi:MAG: hypothetical protein IK057_02445 [Clostridia bacterium]|nr:hypothetical protein [Clostridia bacterium]